MTAGDPPTDTIAGGDPRVRLVGSFDELVTTQFMGGVNALCWQRQLPGDFAQVATLLAPTAGVAVIEDADLSSLPTTAAGRIAADALLADQELLRDLGAQPVLNCIRDYPRDQRCHVVPTDVYSFHVDSAQVRTDTWLCTYHGAPTQALCNEDAVRRVEVPATRAELLKSFGGAEGANFDEFLEENFYDLQFTALAGARPWCMGTFNLWRVAVEYPGSPVPAFIHRAPCDIDGTTARLLLIA